MLIAKFDELEAAAVAKAAQREIEADEKAAQRQIEAEEKLKAAFAQGLAELQDLAKQIQEDHAKLTAELRDAGLPLRSTASKERVAGYENIFPGSTAPDGNDDDADTASIIALRDIYIRAATDAANWMTPTSIEARAEAARVKEAANLEAAKVKEAADLEAAKVIEDEQAKVAQLQEDANKAALDALRSIYSFAVTEAARVAKEANVEKPAIEESLSKDVIDSSRVEESAVENAASSSNAIAVKVTGNEPTAENAVNSDKDRIAAKSAYNSLKQAYISFRLLRQQKKSKRNSA